MKNHLIFLIFISLSVIGCSNESTDSVINDDTITPAFKEELPADITVECDNIPFAKALSSANVCNSATVTMSETISGDNDECPNEYIIIRIWTLNNCGDSPITHSQTITVEDNTLPIFNEVLPSNETVEFNNIPSAASLTATDNCDTIVSVSFSETTEGDNDTTPNDFIITRAWVANDCAGNSISHQQIITVQDNTSNYKFLKSIRNYNATNNNTGARFIYENDKLSFVHLYECSSDAYAFEYNANGKISKSYNKGYYIFDSSTFNLADFKSNSDLILEYIYEGDKLVDKKSPDGFVYSHFSYDTSGRLQVMEEFLPGGPSFLNKTVLTYNSNGQVISLHETGYNNSDYKYTFEYDTNPNPMYVLNQTLGLLALQTCEGVDYISGMDSGLKVFPNNVTKVFIDGAILFDCTYEYDTDGYPKRMSYINYIGNYSAIELIEYY